MHTLLTDQEGALVSTLIGKTCDRFSIKREFVGTQAHNYLAESHIRIVKLTALKLWKDVERLKLPISQDECVSEAAMAQNLMLSYNGVCPAQA